MFYATIITGQFKKDYKNIQHRKSLVEKLDEVIMKLVHAENLDKKFKVHRLTGNYKDCLECHIQPDWLLIWKIDNKENTLTLIRTGSHSDLF